MAPRRLSNGRSPLVNQQRQITAFFCKPANTNSQSQSHSHSNLESKSPSPDPTPCSKLNPNATTASNPITPSSINSKSNRNSTKPQLVIGRQPSFSPPTATEESPAYGEDVVNKRIRVYWPLDKTWYEGCVKSFNRVSGEHLVEYDDGEDEMLDLSKEKIDWLEGSVKKFKRLKKVAVVMDDEEEEVGVGDDSSDENWGENVENEEVEDLEDMELEDEVEEDVESAKKKGRNTTGTRKRKPAEEEKASFVKKKKESTALPAGSDFGSGNKKLVETGNNNMEGNPSSANGNAINGDALERFGSREAEKLYFLGKDQRDAKKRRPRDPNYDPRTLYLPNDFLKRLTGGQRQWWNFKSKHMDKVLFFKMGKFYELFEMDAHVGVKELDLQYMKGDQPHCGFPEKNFSRNLEKLANKGYRVLVIEQTETPQQLEIRCKEEGSRDKVVRREICGVVTKGTLTEGEILSANPDASYIMSVTESCLVSVQQEERILGICCVDVATSRIVVGQVKDNVDYSTLCCLLSELRPVEIIKPAKVLRPECERVLARYTRNPLINELIPGSEFWDADKTINELQKFYSCHSDRSVSSSKQNMKDGDSIVEDDLQCLPDVLNELVCASDRGSLALSALGGTIFYLRQAFLEETLLQYAKFEMLPSSGLKDVIQKPFMVLDAAALENLEIFENSRNGDSAGTLYAYLNHCVTASGKRLLKSWLARPSYNSALIKDRQDAVAALKEDNLSSALAFRKELAKLPDMERLLTRLFNSCEANGRNANKIVLYEDAAKKQLQEFISALRGCELMIQACSCLASILDNVNSRLLHHLLVPGRGLPDVSSVTKHFKDAFDWTEANSSGRIIPSEGVDIEYDSASEKIKEIESSLRKHLKAQQKLLGNSSINYVTVGKESYLLEVPESLGSRVPREYELRSSKKGFYRYWTPDIKEMLGELQQAESERESKLKSILQRLVGQFCENHLKWRQLISTVSELDVLISIAIASDCYDGPTCRPIISDACDPNEVPHLTAKSLGHPVLKGEALGKGTFVPNDIRIGGSGSSSFILLTGPNMGGKSTLLRQVCMAVILAQVGADVPAEHFELSLVDRIFVRMGAKDHIMAGQSTFLIELSETASMLTCATRNSLVALDELGRGTSTSDGQAIAESVLEHCICEVGCRGMFCTHYHRLAVDYKSNPKVSLCHMACQVGTGAGGMEEVTFLYRLSPGACPKSYGVNVARLAGIPDSVLRRAAMKSQEFEAAYGRKRARTNDGYRPQGWEEEAVDFTKKLITICKDSSCHESSQTARISFLSELQHKARILLEQN